MVRVETPPAACPGFWLRATDPGFKTVYALLPSAYHSGTRIRIGGSNADPLAGSTSAYCRISYAALIPG
jgi:hypothetical protein